MQPVDDLCNYRGGRERGGLTERERGDYTVTGGYKQDEHSGHSKFSNIRRESSRTEGGEEINTTFAVQFMKGHCSWLSGGVTDVEFNDGLFVVVVPLFFDKKKNSVRGT